MPPDDFSAAACTANHNSIAASLTRIETAIGTQTARVDNLAEKVAGLSAKVDSADWGSPPAPATMGGDTRETVYSASTIVWIVKKYGPILALLLGGAGLGFGASGSSPDDVRRQVRQAVVEALEAQAEDFPPPAPANPRSH